MNYKLKTKIFILFHFILYSVFIFWSCGKKEQIQKTLEIPRVKEKTTSVSIPAAKEKKVVAKYRYRGEVYRDPFIPLDDKKTFQLLQQAHTTGVFQLESAGMKRYLKLLEPSEFEDIIAMVALYRPGPMEWIPDFIARKHGKKRINYLHPKLEPILKNTYGVAVYQEQIMQIARDLAGFTMGEADVLRKAMGKKIPQLIKEQKTKFIEGCIKNKIERKIAEKVFNFIEPFAGYAFNKAMSSPKEWVFTRAESP